MWCIEGGVQWHEDRAQLEERVRSLRGCQYSDATAVMVKRYRCELNIVTQRHSNSVAFLHAPLLQASGEGIGVAIERFICEDCALVMRDDPVGIWSAQACHSRVCGHDSRIPVAKLPYNARKVL